MTDIMTTAPITIRRSNLLCVKLPNLGIGAAIVALTEAMGQAFDFAYVAPYWTLRQTLVSSDAGQDGRDPNW